MRPARNRVAPPNRIRTAPERGVAAIVSRACHSPGSSARQGNDNSAKEVHMTYGSAVKGIAASALAAVLLSVPAGAASAAGPGDRSEEHTPELQSLMRISYAV